MKIGLNRIKKLGVSIAICFLFIIMVFSTIIGQGLSTDWTVNSNELDEVDLKSDISTIEANNPVIRLNSSNFINISCGIAYGGYGLNMPYADVILKNNYDLDVGESAEVWASIYVDIQLKELDNIGGTVRVHISWLHDPNVYWEGYFTETFHGWYSIKSQLNCNSTYYVCIYVNYTWPNGSVEDTGNAKITTKERQRPPIKPSAPIGPTYLRSGEVGNFSVHTTDPDGDQIYYMFDWGEGENNTGWIGPYKSGRMVTVSKSWSNLGDSIKTIDVRVKAKDINELESEWSDPLTVKMVKNKAVEYNILTCFIEKLVQCFSFFEKILTQYYN